MPVGSITRCGSVDEAMFSIFSMLSKPSSVKTDKTRATSWLKFSDFPSFEVEIASHELVIKFTDKFTNLAR